jgi:menaquinone-9 beta-reductase
MEGLTAVPENSDYDLIVVGGGPAGAAAAITAARAGVCVLMLERGRLPRQRVCGEFVSAESLDLLVGLLGGTGTSLLEQAVRIRQARLFVDGHVLSTPVEPSAASIARFDLDASLWNAAEAAGVDVRAQTAVETISGSAPFRVATSGGEFAARAVINATGRWSNLTGKGALPSGAPGERWLGVKAHFAEQAPHASVDLYFFAGGYCGVQPVSLAARGDAEGRINACAMVRADVARTLSEVFACHPQLERRSQGWESLMEPVSTSPLIFRTPQPTQDGMLQAGDAAGFVDPFVGDGISLALRSGAAATKCLIPFFARKISQEAAAARYGEAYERRLLPVFRSSSRIRRLLKLPRPLRSSILHLLQHTPSVTRYLVSATR